jgi:hypothetical protein
MHFSFNIIHLAHPCNRENEEIAPRTSSFYSNVLLNRACTQIRVSLFMHKSLNSFVDVYNLVAFHNSLNARC